MELEPEIKMQEWIHPRCGTKLTVPYDGVSGHVCEGCGVNVTIPKFGTNRSVNRKKKNNGNRTNKNNEWDWRRPQTPVTQSPFNILETEVYRVTPQRPLQTHIEGYKSIKMVMYVQRVDFIVDLFDVYGIEKAEIIVGDSVVTKNRSSTEPEIFLRLAQLIEEGQLSVRVPKKNRTFHEKWILAEKEGQFADIFGTANLTSRGSGKTGKQSNQVRVQTIEGEFNKSDRFVKLLEQYDWYYQNSELYLDELVDLLKQDDAPDIEVVERWVSYTGSSASADATKVHAIIHEFQEKALIDSTDPDIIVTELTTEANEAVLNEVVKILAPAGIQREGRKISATTRPFLDTRVSTFPLMTINEDRISLRVGSETICRTAIDYDIDGIRKGILGLHSYAETAERASCKNLKFAKMSIYEVMLYFLTSPFHHAYMKQGKKILGWEYQRGPKPLAIYGNTKNGKTYLLQYCSRLLTGNSNKISAYDDDNFSATKVKNILTWSSLFPIIYDDISDTKWGKQYMDQIVRSYWDNWWESGKNHSQLIITSNKRVPQGQLKGRMKEIVMDARFEDSTANIKHVSDIMKMENPIFLYFSKMYLEMLESGVDDVYDHTDCMNIGRLVMKKLYKTAGIEIPDYFPHQAIEKVVDGNGLDWLSMINNGDVEWKITPQRELHLKFTNNEDRYEVKRQMDLIPESLGPKRRGEKIVIPVPSEFTDWLRRSLPMFEVKRLSRNLKKLLKY